MIIRLLQQKGHRVAMIGDGTNDTLALKAADVGISFVEHSSPMAKRAAQILVRDIADVLPVLEATSSIRRQAGFIALGITGLFLAILLGDCFWLLPQTTLQDRQSNEYGIHTYSSILVLFLSFLVVFTIAYDKHEK